MRGNAGAHGSRAQNGNLTNPSHDLPRPEFFATTEPQAHNGNCRSSIRKLADCGRSITSFNLATENRLLRQFIHGPVIVASVHDHNARESPRLHATVFRSTADQHNGRNSCSAPRFSNFPRHKLIRRRTVVLEKLLERLFRCRCLPGMTAQQRHAIFDITRLPGLHESGQRPARAGT